MTKPFTVSGMEEFDELPACYAGLADAFEEYEDAQRDGFDGGLNEFLAMKRQEIEDGNDEAFVDHRLGELFARNRYSIIEKLCKKWLDEVRRG